MSTSEMVEVITCMCEEQGVSKVESDQSAVSQDNPLQDVAKERAEATFQILDTNHDGQLNEDEFVEVQFVLFDLTGL